MRLWFFLRLWSVLWHIGLPIVLIYLWKRGRKDPLYGQHLGERFGRYSRAIPGAVWVHAVSLGELRSAVPLIRALLDRGESVVTSHFTPAGRREAERVFAAEISDGRLRAVWVPFETSWAYAGFFRAFQPRFGLVMEIEIWPRMIFAARRAGVPLFMCNAQYPTKSMARDAKLKLRHKMMQAYAGAFVKSDLQRDRFASVGVQNIHVTGELRFDQPIPEVQLQAARVLRPMLPARNVIAFASMTEPEEGLFLDVIQTLTSAPEPPFVILVPRAPERFDPVADALAARGLPSVRRSMLLTETLGLRDPSVPLASGGVLLGDSLGEMYFYLALADRVVVGGGFQPKGSHTIIEPLALGKPVIVGPEIHTIEYPAVEAITAGVCLQTSEAHLARDLSTWPDPAPSAISAFFAVHAGATEKTLAALAGLGLLSGPPTDPTSR